MHMGYFVYANQNALSTNRAGYTDTLKMTVLDGALGTPSATLLVTLAIYSSLI